MVASTSDAVVVFGFSGVVAASASSGAVSAAVRRSCCCEASRAFVEVFRFVPPVAGKV